MNTLKELKRISVKDSVEGSTEEKQIIKEINEAKVEKKEDKTPDFSALIKESLATEMAKIKESFNTELSQVKEESQKIFAEKEAQINQDWSEKLKALETQLQETKQELEVTKKTEQNLADLFKLHGSQNTEQKFNVNVNTVTTTDSDNPYGICKEAFDIVESSRIVKPSNGGDMYSSYDYESLDNFVAENRSQVIKDLESWGRKNGLLQGQRTIKEAATVASDIIGGFLTTLSSLVRTTHIPGFIFAQFANTRIDFEKRQGTTIQVHRSRYFPAPTNENDWLLSGGGTFVDIDTTYQNVATGVVEIVLNEWGMGKASTVNNPVRIPTFVMAYSMIELMSIVNRNIGYNYNQFLDLKVRNLWKPTSRVIYNDKGFIATAPTALDTGDNGTMTRNFLVNLYSYMHTIQIPPMSDGCYGLAIHPTALAQLKLEFESKWEVPTPQQLADLTNILLPANTPPAMTGQISGYQGKYYGFHIFETNATSVGAAGSEGVRNETLGGSLGATLTRTSYAFGVDTIARGIGDPMEIRQNEITGYGRKSDYIWLSNEGFAPLDVDPTGYSDASAIPQQLRVLDVRTLDVAV
jgi:hypothetical protein